MNRSNVSIVAAAGLIAAAIVAAPHLAPSPRVEGISSQVPDSAAGLSTAPMFRAADYVFVAQTRGVDDSVDDHILALLLRNGIHAKVGGEFVYGVSVPHSQKDRAIALLAVDADQKGYWISFDTDFSTVEQ